MNRSYACLMSCLLMVSVVCANPQDPETPFITLTRSPMKRRQLPTNITVITKEKIQELGATTLSEVLETLPSVDISRSGGLGSFSTVRMRGVPASNQVQIIIDDQSLGGSSIQNIDVGLIPVDNIERIEIIRGGGSVLYGANAIGGVIHIITKRQTQDLVSASSKVEIQSHQTKIVQAESGVRTNHFDAFATGQWFQTNGYVQNDKVRSRSVSANMGYSFGSGARVSVDYSLTDQEQGTSGGTKTPFKEWDGEKERQNPISPTDRIIKDSERERVKLSIPLGAGMLLHTQGHHLIDNVQFFSSFPGKFRNTILGNDTKITLPFGLTVGGAYERDERISLGQTPHHITNWGLYLQETFDWSKVSFIPAIRLDQHSLFGTEFNPRFSAVYHPVHFWKLSANIARSFRAPTLTDLFEDFPPSFFSNENLRPEIAWTYDAGTEFVVQDWFQVEISGYYMRIKDRIAGIDTDGDAFNDTQDNTSLAELTGAELGLSFKTWLFDHELNYARLRAQGNSVNSARFVRLRLTPPNIANYSVKFPFPGGVQLQNSLQYSDHQYAEDDKGGLLLPSYLLWHARLDVKHPFGSVYFSVRNISDKIYAESISRGIGVPMPGRTYIGGVKIKFPFNKGKS